MSGKTATINTWPGLKKVLAELPKEAQKELRIEARQIATVVANESRQAAAHVGGVAALVAPGITARRDRIPTIRMGSTTRIRSRTQRDRRGPGQTISDIAFGAEFGGGAKQTTPKGGSTMQFLPHRGTLGYFLWPTVRDRSEWMQRQYSEALLRAMRRTP